ncbi:hypothetical protein [Bradyrhizobium sp. HKCCYLR20261]|uniref:hypothetical protein n=1 Tax=unclassified Bradyrhizobium TaxID=2631580 RepID=UPI003EBE7C28
MRITLASAIVLAAFGGLVAVAQARQETAPELVPVVRADGSALAQLAGREAGHDDRTLSYEPARREREGDDDDQDEPRR